MVVTGLLAGVARKHLVWGVLVICLLCALILEMRAFAIGYGAALLYLWAAERQFHITKIKALCLVGGFIIAVGVVANFSKHDSSLGRFLIYKVSSNMLSHHWLTGIGWGNFKTQYLYYQADYFKGNHYSKKELLLADNTYYAFNDYYQLLIELGITAAVLLMSLFYGTFALIRCTTAKIQVYSLTTIAIAQIIAILLAAVFTHVFDALPCQIVLLACFSIIMWQHAKNMQAKGALLAIALMIATGCIYTRYYFQIRHYAAYQKYNESVTLMNAGFRNRALAELEAIYPALDGCPEYLDYYGSRLAAFNPQKALPVLRRAQQYWTSNTLLLSIAVAQSHMHDSANAIKNFNTCIYMVPNRFETRLALANFYFDTGRRKEGRQEAMNILALPIKVPSKHVTFIKDYARRQLATSP